ncbi:MAG: O-antigen ligase family protein [Elusimicrobia bacterium]|nr:O-antigen ligase family protein [Elusimicrobiota bacterium]
MSPPLTLDEKTGAERFIFAAGAMLVVLAAAPYRVFDLDRFFAPKELALHAAALALVPLGLARARALKLERVDLALALYLLLGLVSAWFAPDRWLAARALAVTLSGAGIFWAARSAARAGARRAIIASVGAAAVLGAAAALAQAYGLGSALFSLHRIPGGTLGNRNFAAHLAVVCAPALVLAVLRARRGWAAAAGAAGLAALAAALVLTRSRTALLGLLAGAGVLAYGWRRWRGLWTDDGAAFRLRALLLAPAVGVLAALLLPNTLEWKSRSPYLDTVTGIVDYRRGSGHGRLVQYARTLRIAAAHPLLGIGPGNWSVVYPKSVDGFDRSIDYNTGRTTNPWPSSDWAAVACERGLPALAAILLAFFLLFSGAWREGSPEGLALAAVLASATVVGCFDAFLLLPAPSFLVWALAGALAAASPAAWSVELSPSARRALAAAAAVLWGAAALRSSGQIAAMALYSRAHTAAQLARAALCDPGSARISSRLKALRGRARAAAPAAAPQTPEPADAADDAPEEPEQWEAPAR